MDIIELRRRFLVEFVTNRFHYHEEDAKRVQESDFWVNRFLMHKNQGGNSAFYHMKDTFKWKKSFGIHEFNQDLDIPREIYQMYPIFSLFLPDKRGIIPIYIRCKMIIRIEELEHQMKLFFFNVMDTVDNRIRKPFGWSLIFDCSDAGFENANFDLMFFVMDMIKKHYPLQPKYVLAYNISWILKPFVKMGLSMMPQEAMNLLDFIDTKEDLFQRIPETAVPEFMGGRASLSDHVKIPEKSQSCTEVMKRLLPNMNSDEINRILEPLLMMMRENDNNNGLENSADPTNGSRRREIDVTKSAYAILEEFD